MFKKVVYRGNHFRSSEHKSLTDQMYKIVLCCAEWSLALPTSLEQWNGQTLWEQSALGKAGLTEGLADSTAW